jgi:SWI/SNF-related matrix-associated actin-dependent regulator of chromatin subfamily A member 5
MVDRPGSFNGLSSENEAPSENDAEYVPDTTMTKKSSQPYIDSQTKLKYLMDKIDSLTNSLNKCSIQKNVDTDTYKRHKGLENEDEKTLICKDASLYTFKLSKQPKSIIGGTMREYQLEGLNWLLKMHYCNINGILADEMGLGKTLQTISLIAQLVLEEETTPNIIIVPKSTLANWTKEFKRWCPSIEVFEFYAGQHERELLRSRIPRTDSYHVLLTTYETAMAEKILLKGVKWNYLIIDEAHRIKNEKSVLSQVVRLFSTKHRLLITGTPLQNNLLELWALLNFLMPSIFSSSQDFNEWFDLSSTTLNDQSFIIQQLHRILRPFMLRRLKREVETKLPAKKELYVFLGMTEIQRELYRKILTRNIDVLNGFGEKSQLMNTIMQLRKTCNHPYLFEGIEPGPPFIDGEHLIEASMKFKFLDKLIPRIIGKGSKILIFTQMTRLLNILDDFLNFRGYKFCRIDGSTHYIDRESQIEKFQEENSDINVFILSTRAGGLGINLHAANTVIIYDSDWNPQVDIQAQDRAHRIGQTKVVTIYRFISEGTVEEKIAERAAKKLKMDHLVIQKGALASSNKNPSVQEMNTIVQFGAQQVLKSTGQTILEEDIDKLLMYSEEKTKEINQELTKLEEAFNLNNFSFDGKSFYDFEGNNYKEKKKEHISLGTRNRKSTGFYEVNKTNSHRKQKKKGWRVLVGGGHPFQFFPSEELDELDLKEDKWNDYLNEKPRRRTRGDIAKKPEKFTDEDAEKRAELIEEGFSSWSKREFNSFIKGCETFGRNSFKEIAEEIETKDIKEVKEYAAVFWEKFDTLPNGKELLQRIEQGEKDIKRLFHIKNVLEEKKKRIADGEDILIDYTPDNKYTTEEDLYLVKYLLNQGYGDWDSLRILFKTSSQFKFNFWMQTRTPEDLQNRCEYLISNMEKTSNLDTPRKIRKLNEENEPFVEISQDYSWIITFPKIILS